MPGHYAANPHYAAADFDEQRERQERAEAVASDWFNDLASEQLQRHRDRMIAAAAYKGAPRWDRQKAAADREFAETTVEASRVAEMVFGDMMAFGEVTEATSYAFDEALTSQIMTAADPADKCGEEERQAFPTKAEIMSRFDAAIEAIKAA